MNGKQLERSAGAETQAAFCSQCGRKIERPVQPAPAAPPEDQEKSTPPVPEATDVVPAVPTAGGKRCARCGADWGPEFRFCPNCGDELASAVPDLKLVVHSPDGTTHEVALDGSTIVLGTGPETAFRLRDPYASKKHCRFAPTAQGGYQVEDLGSSNGTFARLSGPAPVTPGSSFLLGTSLVCVEQG